MTPLKGSRIWFHPTWMLAGILLLVLFFVVSQGGLLRFLGRVLLPAHVPVLAVLPFDSLSDDPDQRFLAEGMTEQLITDLGQLEGLRILSRGSVMRYADKHVPLEKVAMDLQVDAIVEGSITRGSGRLHVTANLYQVAARKHLWSQTYEKEISVGTSPQQEIALDIAQRVQANLVTR